MERRLAPTRWLSGTPAQRGGGRELARLLAAGVREGAFPGAVAAVGLPLGHARVALVARAGRTGDDGRPVRARTRYDLASLTKPFVATAGLRLAARGLLSLDAPAATLVPELGGTPGGAATLRELLSHRGGMDAWGALHREVPHAPGSAEARAWMILEAARRGAPDARGDQTYSDLGYFVASEALARAAGTTVRRLVEVEVLAPLRHDPAVRRLVAGRLDLGWGPCAAAAPTERCDWRGRVVRGEVHDENCAAAGGAAGNAGLFGTAAATLAFGEAVLGALEGRSRLLPQHALVEALAPQPGGSHVVGWDTRSPGPSSTGTRMGPRTFGHLGFTGTSLWIDPDALVTVVLLTNRVHPTRAREGIRTFRPRLHDAAMEVASRWGR